MFLNHLLISACVIELLLLLPYYHIQIHHVCDVYAEVHLWNFVVHNLLQKQVGWLPWLHTSWRDWLWEGMKTNCKRQSKRQLPSSPYNHTTLKTSVKDSL